MNVDLKISHRSPMTYRRLKDIDAPDEAISNVEKMKKMFDSAKVDKEADDTNLYG